MAGHSHWASIKHKKAIADEKRSKIFSKFARMITIAAREKGGDPEKNPQLRMIIERAKEFNMPQENIERAIKRGTGELKGSKLERLLLEGIGPGGVALLIEAITDNKNRTLAEIRHLLEKFGGKLASGGVKWQFEQKGVIQIDFEDQKEEFKDKEKLELLAIEAGAEDLKTKKEGIEVYTLPQELDKVKRKLEENGVKIEKAGLEWVAKEEMSLANEEAKRKLEELFKVLDEHDDVQEIYSNLALT